MRFVIVTGMSGAGKLTAMKLLEDIGFYCVDNLPIPLVDKLFELIATSNSEITKIALGVDVRADQNLDDARKIFKKLKDDGYDIETVFMDAGDATLIKRYKESRRIHPLAVPPANRVEDGIHREREILKEIKKEADYIFDTSNLLTRDLKEEFGKIFVTGEAYNGLVVNIMSFGFKHGIPADADLVFDVRFLPNPYYIEELKPLTGNNKEVQDYVMSFRESEEFLSKLEDMLKFLIPGYVNEGKHQLVVAIGCTGGQHRSVTLANELYSRMRDSGNFGLALCHRDAK